MASKNKYPDQSITDVKTVPFESAEEAWFWFMSAQQARMDGARFVSGAGLYPRPCEPLDILKALDRLYRNRRLLRDHVLVLRHYGRRMLPPDAHRTKEARAHTLWHEALERIEDVLEAKGIVSKSQYFFHNQIHNNYEGVAAE